MARKGAWVRIPLLSPMKLLQLHEAGYANAKTLERVMSYVKEDASIQDGIVMKIKQQYDNKIQHIQYLSVQRDEDDDSPYMIISYFGQDDNTDALDPEEFVEMVEVYATKRIL